MGIQRRMRYHLCADDLYTPPHPIFPILASLLCSRPPPPPPPFLIVYWASSFGYLIGSSNLWSLKSNFLLSCIFPFSPPYSHSPSFLLCDLPQNSSSICSFPLSTRRGNNYLSNEWYSDFFTKNLQGLCSTCKLKSTFFNLPYKALQNLPQIPLQLPLQLISHMHWYLKHTILISDSFPPTSELLLFVFSSPLPVSQVLIFSTLTQILEPRCSFLETFLNYSGSYRFLSCLDAMIISSWQLQFYLAVRLWHTYTEQGTMMEPHCVSEADFSSENYHLLKKHFSFILCVLLDKN